MRQLTYLEAGRVAWQEAPDPEPADPAGAVVRPLAVARCDLDPIMAGLGIFPGPFAVGHETVAEVVAVGEDVRDRAVGDRVLVPFQVSCGSCDACRDGRFAACHTYRAKAGAAFGFGAAGGGHGGAVADLLAVPHADHLLLAAPAGLTPVALCTLPDNATDGYRAVGPQLAGHPGAEVLVVGGAAASIGLYAVAAAIACGAGRVRYVDADADALRGRDRARRRRHPARRPVAAALRSRADRRREHRRRRRPRLRAALDRRLRDLHERRDPLRSDDAAAAARALHEGDHLPPLTRGLAQVPPGRHRAGRERRARPAGRPDDDRALGPRRRGVAGARDEARARAHVGA